MPTNTKSLKPRPLPLPAAALRTALYLLRFLCLLCFPIVAGATTVVGTVTDAADNPAPDGSKIIFRLSQEGTVTDPALLLQQPPVTCTITSGSIDAGCTVRSNDDVSPAGTFYKVRIVTPAGSQLLPERSYTITGTTWNIGIATPLASETVAATAYQIIQDDGTNVAQRTTMNFQGTGVSVADNSGTGITDITISSGAGATHQIDSAPLAAQDPINLLDTTEFDWTNPAAGDLSLALKAGFLDGLTDLAGTLCGTGEILEDQGGSWACIATPSGSGGSQHQVDGVNLIDNTTVNFRDTAAVLFSNPSAGNIDATIAAAGVTDAMLANNYSGVGSCAASNFVTALNDNAAPTCAQPAFSDLSGSATDAQVPDNITIATLDTTFTLQDDLDNTKQLNLQLSSIATATTRTWTAPDASGEVTLLGQTIEAGELAFDPEEEAHASEHQHGGADEIATATPAANAIPKADGSGTLANGWLPAHDVNCITDPCVQDSEVVDTITASNYLLLAGGTLTGQLVTDNLGIEFTESDTNPGCVAGNFTIFADLSEGLLKKCQDGTVSNLDTTGGAGGGYDTVAGDTGTASKTSTESLKFAGTASEIDTAVTTDDTTQDVVTWSLDSTVAQTDVAKSWSALQTFLDTTFELADDLDNTKQLNLQLSSIATATTRTWTAPDASGEVTLLGQTIEDAELASNYSGVGSCAASNFATVLNDNAAPTCAQPAFSDLSGSATDAQVPDNITIATLDTTFTLQDDLDNTKQLNLQLSSIATATTRTWTAPDASGEVTLLGQTIEDAELASNYSGVGSCTNQFPRALNDNAAPTCEDVAPADFASQTANTVLAAPDGTAGDPTFRALVDGDIPAGITRDTEAPAAGDISGSLSAGYTIDAGAVASTEIAAANKTFKCNFVLFDPTNGLADTDDIETISNCSRPGRPITITEVHCEVDAGTGTNINLQRDDGTPANILSSDLNCTTSGANGTIDAAEDNFAATDKLDFVMVAAGTANRLSVLIEYTVD